MLLEGFGAGLFLSASHINKYVVPLILRQHNDENDEIAKGWKCVLAPHFTQIGSPVVKVGECDPQQLW